MKKATVMQQASMTRNKAHVNNRPLRVPVIGKVNKQRGSKRKPR